VPVWLARGWSPRGSWKSPRSFSPDLRPELVEGLLFSTDLSPPVENYNIVICHRFTLS
jgi:hypothetical protein